METSTTKSAFTTKRMVEIALITAVICILAPFAIPIPVSPVLDFTDKSGYIYRCFYSFLE